MDRVLYYVIEVSIAKPDQWRKFPHCLKKVVEDGMGVYCFLCQLMSCMVVWFLIYLDPTLGTIRTKEFHVMSIKI